MAVLGGVEQGVVAMKSHPAQVARAEAERLEAAAGQIDPVEFTAAGIAHPEAAPIPARRMGYRQAPGHDGVGLLHINHQAIGMAAVFCGQARDDRRPPQLPEAVGGQSGEQGVHEHQLNAGSDGQVVDVAVAGVYVVQLGHVVAIEAVGRLPRAEHVLETSDLIEAAHLEAIAATAGAEAHAAVEGALEHRQLTIGLEAEAEELADLVGGKGDRKLLLGHPGLQLAEGADR